MPIYEYRCNECGKVFSRLQKVGATADGVVCPECGSSAVDRMLSTFASASSSAGTGAPCGAQAASCTGFT